MLSFFIFFAEFCSACTVYPFMPSGFFYHNYLDQSISNSRVSGLFLLFLFLLLPFLLESPVLNPNSTTVFTICIRTDRPEQTV